MDKYIEFKGKNVDDALGKASDQLNVPVGKIKHEVLAYGSSGIFGLVGVKKAKIKVFLEGMPKKADRPQAAKVQPANGEIEETSALPIKSADQAPPVDDVELEKAGILSLQTIVDKITTGATVELRPDRVKWLFSISGGDSGVLIGKRGQTLEAIQYLLEKIINKKAGDRIRVQVDVAGYIEKRKNNLHQMASRMAEKAKRSNKPVTIGQMNAHDRRIVHIHLKDEIGIRTQSIGDGYFRKLMIFPKKQAATKPDDNDGQG